MQFLRISRSKSWRFSPAGPFFLVLYMIAYQSALISRKLPCPKNFLVTRLMMKLFAIIVNGVQPTAISTKNFIVDVSQCRKYVFATQSQNALRSNIRVSLQLFSCFKFTREGLHKCKSTCFSFVKIDIKKQQKWLKL